MKDDFIPQLDYFPYWGVNMLFLVEVSMDNKILIDIKKAIGSHLRYLRETHGYTVDNMMRITGLDLSRLQQIEHGEFNSLEELLTISYMLNMTLKEIVVMIGDCECVEDIVTFNRILFQLTDSNRDVVLKTLKTLCEALIETQ